MAAHPDRGNYSVSFNQLLRSCVTGVPDPRLTSCRDRADYLAALNAHVSYTVPTPQDAPNVLKFGPSFATLAGKYEGSVVLGTF
jgi:hypothetical protein